MAISVINNENFDSIVENNAIVVIDFWAPWCGPCLSFGKIMESVSEEYPAIFFGKVNIDEESSLKEEFQIVSIPQVMIFKEKILIFNQSGAMPASALRTLLNDAINLDVSGIE